MDGRAHERFSASTTDELLCMLSHQSTCFLNVHFFALPENFVFLRTIKELQRFQNIITSINETSALHVMYLPVDIHIYDSILSASTHSKSGIVQVRSPLPLDHYNLVLNMEESLDNSSFVLINPPSIVLK